MAKADNRQSLQTGLSLHQAGRLDSAGKVYRQILASDPDNPQALHFLGLVEANLGNFEQAKSLMARSLQVTPANIQFVENFATILFQSGDYERALQVCRRALSSNGNNVSLLYVGAIALYKLKRFDEAVAGFDKLLKLQPNHVAAINERASALAELREYDAALAGVRMALAIEPHYAEAHLNAGNLYGKLKRHDDALASFDTALALKPGLADAWLGRGNVFVDLKRHEEALAAYDKALSIKPDFENAWLGRGNVFYRLKRHGDALTAYDTALSIRPDLENAWLGRGNVFADLKRHEEAIAAYDKALALKPDLAEAWIGRGNVLAELKRYEEALAAYEKALAHNPDLNHAASARLHVKLHLCDWTNLKADAAELLSISREKVTAVPGTLLSIPASPSDLLECTRRYVDELPRFAPLCRGEIYSHDRIRIAYLSADFREHPVAYLTAGLFEQHDRSRFEVTGISLGTAPSPIGDRIKGAFERFVEIGDETDQDIAELIRRSEIDIAVDLMGHTEHSRFGVFGRRPAPIQAIYLGYAGTTGADYIDYILADPTIVPEDQFRFYAEQAVWLPSYQVNDNKRQISERTPSRAECGLPNAGFVFSCFNNSFKITPEMFDIWMRLLQAVDGSVLWLSRHNKTAVDNLCREAERRGVAANRLVFAERVPQIADHLARLRLADLFLDTLPYNAHTTASDALWAGLPVLTCVGSAFPGRIAASVLKSAGLDELVTASLDDYEALALKIARDRALLAALKAKIARNRNACPLFDTTRFTRNIEQAYTTMVERHSRGERPHSFRVADGTRAGAKNE